MAKAIYLKDFKDPLADEYRELHNRIIENSKANKLVYPASHYHRTESENSRRVKDIVWRVTDFLSADTRFLHSVILLSKQVYGAAAKFIGAEDR
ncbi:MAG: hypothetical protein OSB68_01550 [Dehalococcoidia bacterium]|nr:hypothetical protein [Dehalococcoidia bacterium]